MQNISLVLIILFVPLAINLICMLFTVSQIASHLGWIRWHIRYNTRFQINTSASAEAIVHGMDELIDAIQERRQ